MHQILYRTVSVLGGCLVVGWAWLLGAPPSAGAAATNAAPRWFNPRDAQGDAAQPTRKRVAASQWLEGRKRKQLESIRNARPFHGFQFRDVAPESGITFDQRPVDDACKDWIPVHYDHGNAVAVADVDGDGLTDVYLLNQLGPSRLYRNLGAGRFEDFTATAGLALEDRVCVGASFADIDNDGDPDLFVTTVRKGNALFENLGSGRFQDITSAAGVDYVGHSSGAVFLDYDRDGLLDLFVCNVGVYTSGAVGRGGFFRGLPDAFSGHLFPERSEASLLYRNLGQRRFANVTATAGLAPTGWCGDASFADLDEDGFPDLYVLNMQGDDHFFRNVGGQRCGDATEEFFPVTPWGAMGIKFFDYNNDGRLDLYVTDMHSDMTDAQTRQFRMGTDARMEKQRSERFCGIEFTEAFLQGAANNVFGNAFYENRGGGRFAEVCLKLGLETYWPWGASAADINADGFEDLLVTAGMGYPYRYGINSLLLNDRGQRFVDAEFALGLEPRRGGRTEKTAFVLYCSGADTDHPLCRGESGRVSVPGTLSSRSSVLFDLDLDGDLDAVISEWYDRPQVLVSNLSEKRSLRFLKVQLVGTTSNRDGLGAAVTVHAGGRRFYRYHEGKSGYLAQSSLPLYFGLGDLAQVDRIEVAWPSGKRQTVTTGLALNRLVMIQEE